MLKWTQYISDLDYNNESRKLRQILYNFNGNQVLEGVYNEIKY